MADIFDVIVIGAGPAGENVVDRAARGGLSVAIVEKELAGGECSYWACIPSKTLLRPVELAAEVSRVPGLEVAPIDTAAVLARRDTMIARYDDGGQARWLDSVPATLIRGHGRLTGARQVEVVEPSGDAVQLTARHAVVLIAHGFVERQGDVVHIMVRSLEDAGDLLRGLDAESRDFH